MPGREMLSTKKMRDKTLWKRSGCPVISLFSGISILAFSVVSNAGQDREFSITHEIVLKYNDSSDLNDPIAQFQRKLDSGKETLKFEGRKGYLLAVLKQFNIPISSQTLVFSKTSSQADHTSPKTPRALYFNDTVYIGFALDNENLDVVSMDPKKGAIFYTLKQMNSVKPQFVRRGDCLNCHFGPKTLDVPGLFLRSITTKADGSPVGQVDAFTSGHNSPLKLRWGGWYVTGTHGKDQHFGNAFLGRVKDADKLDLSKSSNITDLSVFMDTSPYPTPHSDAVALLVLDHITRMQNHIIQGNYEARFALHDREQILSGKSNLADWSEKRIAQAGEALVAYLLFRDEAPFNGPIIGTSRFKEDFEKLGPFDSKGRSLRQFDLNTRVFKYPCSFLIYSPSFDNMPDVMRQYVWKRLDEILSGRDRKGLYESMSDEDRKAVMEILLETKPEFRECCIMSGTLNP